LEKPSPMSPPPDEFEPAAGSFPTTHWSVVINAGAGAESQARLALESLCRGYWYPLYSYVRRNGRAHHEAEDCTQEFLARLLATDGVARARPERGRFRTFLLTALRNFLTNEWQRTQAVKRGGGAAVLSLDWQDAEKRFAHEPADPGLTPEQAFDREWARGVLVEATARLRRDSKPPAFDLFREYCLEETGAGYGELAKRYGVSEDDVRNRLRESRQQLREILEDLLRDYLVPGRSVEDELRFILSK